MENNLEFLQVAWAAQRSGLYYAAVNWHLSTDEVAYILQDCGAQVLITSQQMAEVVANLADHESAVRAVLCVDGELPESTHSWKDTFAFDDGPLTDGNEGCELLYSSGHHREAKSRQAPAPPTGRDGPEPQGRAGQLPGHVPHQRGLGLPVAGAALPLGPADELHDHPPHRRAGGRDGALRRRGGAGPD